MENNNVYELIKFVFPAPEYGVNDDFFVRHHAQSNEENVYEFNTWMNLLAAKKLYKYCDLGDIYLKASIIGACCLRIIGTNRDTRSRRIESVLVETHIDSENAVVCVPNAKDYEGVHLVVFEEKNKPIKIISASWMNDKAPVRENKLAIVMCTFKREQYVTCNILKYKHFINEHNELKDRVSLFIVDNARTLDFEQGDETIKVIYNKNTGGTGGFTRGLINAQDEGYNRILFLDDDIEIPPEIFAKTLTLCDYLKDEFKDAFINGAMLNNQNKDILSENIGVGKEFWSVPYRNDLSVYDFDNILNINDVPDKLFATKRVHSSWWFHCFDVSDVAQSGYPFPFFIWYDDIEWSWRRKGRHHISINGLFVWHEPVCMHTTRTRHYYYERNVFVLNMLYATDFKKKVRKYFKDAFYQFTGVYDYFLIVILFLVMDDIAKGSLVFKEDPECKLEYLKQIENEVCYFDATDDELEFVKNNCPGASFIRKAIYVLTFYGKYCPNFFFTKETIALEWPLQRRNFMLRKKAKVFNLVTKKYCIREFNRTAFFSLEKEFYKRLNIISNRYDTLKEEYTQAFNELTSRSFWECYLGIQ